MNHKAWFRGYLLLAGSTILSLGLILFVRNLRGVHSTPGIILGLLFMIYGILRIRQRKQLER